MDNKDEFWGEFNKIFNEKFKDIFKDFAPEKFINNGMYTKTTESGQDVHGNTFTKETYSTKDGRIKFTVIVDTKPSEKPQSKDSNSKANRLYTAEAELQEAIKEQKFERASQLRDEIAKLKNELSAEAKAKTIELLIKRTINADGTFSDKVLTKGITKEKQTEEIVNICTAMLEKYKNNKD